MPLQHTKPPLNELYKTPLTPVYMYTLRSFAFLRLSLLAVQALVVPGLEGFGYVPKSLCSVIFYNWRFRGGLRRTKWWAGHQVHGWSVLFLLLTGVPGWLLSAGVEACFSVLFANQPSVSRSNSLRSCKNVGCMRIWNGL